MAARDHINPHQLKMFMTPHEVMGSVTGSVDGNGAYRTAATGSDMSNLFAKKLAESQVPARTNYSQKPDTHGAGLFESIRTEGVRTPIKLSHGQYENGTPSLVHGEGHHRTASAMELTREGREMYLPVEHSEGMTYDPAPPPRPLSRFG